LRTFSAGYAWCSAAAQEPRATSAPSRFSVLKQVPLDG
jgi:hypothetical protein